MSLGDWLSSGPLRTDGAWGTELQARGQVILTNTFRVSPISLAEWGLESKAPGIHRAGAAISRAAGRGLVSASVGPTVNRPSPNLRTPHGCEANAIRPETMSDFEDAHIALRAALPAGSPAGVPLVFDGGKNKDCTMMGTMPGFICALAKVLSPCASN